MTPEPGESSGGDPAPDRRNHSITLAEERALLWEEYKILQEKLDSIADLRFRVKQWSVTLVLALALGASSARSTWYIILGGGCLVVVAFGLMELFYHWSHNAFAARL